MFPAGEGKWEAVKVRKIVKAKKDAETKTAPAADGDVAMAEADEKPAAKEKPVEEDEESEYEEDPESEDGAVYPLKGALQSPLYTTSIANNQSQKAES